MISVAQLQKFIGNKNITFIEIIYVAKRSSKTYILWNVRKKWCAVHHRPYGEILQC